MSTRKALTEPASTRTSKFVVMSSDNNKIAVSHAIYAFEVVGAVALAYSCKATGPDDIPVLVLKNCRLVIAPRLAKLINECFVLGVFPNVLKIARVTPLFKSGDKSCCNN